MKTNKIWEILLAVFAPVFATASLILILVLSSIFLPDYQDAGPPLGTTYSAHHWRLFTRFVFLPFAVYAIWLWRLFMKREREPEAFWPFLFWTGLVLLLLVPVSHEVFNVALDRSAPLVFQVAVTDKYITSSTSDYASVNSYVLKLQSWRKDRDWHDLAVKARQYDGAKPGRTKVTLRIRPGRFGQPWLESYEVHP